MELPQFGGSLSLRRKAPVRKTVRKLKAKGDDDLIAGRKKPVRKTTVRKAPVRKTTVRKLKARGDEDELIAGAPSNKDMAIHKKANTKSIKEYKKRLSDALKKEKEDLVNQGYDKSQINAHIKEKRKAFADHLKSSLLVASTQIHDSIR